MARTQSTGFTLLELLVVISIMALATAGVSLAIRDGGERQLEREAERLDRAALRARAERPQHPARKVIEVRPAVAG